MTCGTSKEVRGGEAAAIGVLIIDGGGAGR